jgi:hypothetical protein
VRFTSAVLASADYRKLGVRNRTEVRRVTKGAIG